jgi:hypothetical protein
MVSTSTVIPPSAFRPADAERTCANPDERAVDCCRPDATDPDRTISAKKPDASLEQ